MPPDPHTPPTSTTTASTATTSTSPRALGIARYTAIAVTVTLGVLDLVAVTRGWPAAGPLGWLTVAGALAAGLLGLAHQRARQRRRT